MITRLRSEEGFTVLELALAMAITAIVAAIMLTWLGNVSSANRNEAEADAALEDLTTAKARLVRELRFASGIEPSSTAHQVEVWIDVNEDTTKQTGTGEVVTWTIMPTGSLLREADDAPGVPQQHAEFLVYDAGAASGSSRFLYDLTENVITIELVSDFDSSGGPAASSIQTRVHLRNT